MQIQQRQRNKLPSYVGKGFQDRDNIMDLSPSEKTAGYTQDAKEQHGPVEQRVAEDDRR